MVACMSRRFFLSSIIMQIFLDLAVPSTTNERLHAFFLSTKRRGDLESIYRTRIKKGCPGSLVLECHISVSSFSF
jgi:hypothetical protein